jgi:hypothetical protein
MARVIKIRDEEAGAIAQPYLSGKAACSSNRRCGEVKTDDGCSALRNRQRIGPEMALKVQHTFAVQAERPFLPRKQCLQLGLVNSSEPALAPAESGLIVEIAA